MVVVIQIKMTEVHTVCAKVTDKFLDWSKKVGNDSNYSTSRIWFSRFKRWR